MSKSESHCPPGGELGAKVAAQGDLVRQLKADKKTKEEIDSAVKALLALKVSTIQKCDLHQYQIYFDENYPHLRLQEIKKSIN